MTASFSAQAKTLIVYYSYTNNVHRIVTELSKQLDADLLRIAPAEKGLDYAADNYAIGSAQIAAIRNNPDNASSYPAIDPVNINLGDYDCIIVGAPLWWSNMAAPLQTFLFHNGQAMAGKRIGLIVSSAISGISGVERDLRRLVPEGNILAPTLWIRSAQTANSANLIKNWLDNIDYTAWGGIDNIMSGLTDNEQPVYSLSGIKIGNGLSSLHYLGKGIYIMDGKKFYNAD